MLVHPCERSLGHSAPLADPEEDVLAEVDCL